MSRRDELADLYTEKVLITEGEKVQNFARSPGQSFEGEDKVKQKMPNTGVGSKGVNVQKPEEKAELSPGHGKISEEKEERRTWY